MSDSDDYFDNDDDIILDAETLAVLDSAEQTFQQKTAYNQNTETEQASKRRKTVNGWKPGYSNHGLSDTDDLPDIIVENDWYGGVPVTRPRSPPSALSPSTSQQPQRPRVHTSYKPNSTGTYTPSSQQHQVHQRWSVQPASRQHSPVQYRPPSQPTRPSPIHQRQSSQGHPAHPFPAPHVHPSHINRRASTPLSQSQKFSPVHATPVQRPRVLSNGNASGGILLAQESEDVQTKLVELREEMERKEKMLQENLNARYAKEGEVTILRRGIEKAAQEHAQQIAKLKAEKAEADAKCIRIQKEKDLEIERMRSHLQIKRQELESSARKLPGSARQRKFLPLESSGTFSQVPPEIQSWNAIPGPSNIAPHEMASQIPQTPGLGRPRKRMAPPKETLPGFFNSFAAKTPLVSRIQRAQTELESSPSLRLQGNRSTMPPPSPSSSPTRPIADNWNQDGQMDEEPTFTQPIFEPNAPVVEQDPFVGPSKRAEPVSRRSSDATERLSEDEFNPPEGSDRFRIELTRVVIGCIAPSSSEPILKLLMTAQITEGITSGGNTYNKSCAQLLDSLSMFASGVQTDFSLIGICRAFVAIGCILQLSSAITPLISLFHLCASICDIFPSFSKALLSVDQGPNVISGVAHLVAQTLVKPPDTDHSDDTNDNSLLAREALRLVHSLVRHISIAQQERLEPLSQNLVWTALLGEKQPKWLLLNTIRTMTSLATFPEFTKSFVAGLNPQQAESNALDMMCTHLVKDIWDDDENFTLVLAILTCFGALTTATPLAAEPILNSVSFLARTLTLISLLTNRVWDDDNLATEKIEGSLHLLDTAIYLIHSLIFADPNSTYDLRTRLILISRRMDQFSGTFELFMVVFSRLSHDDYPDWIGATGIAKLGTISEFARSLLGEVVDGDEIDLVWQAYQMTIEEPEQSLNDEELEALKHSI